MTRSNAAGMGPKSFALLKFDPPQIPVIHLETIDGTAVCMAQLLKITVQIPPEISVYVILVCISIVCNFLQLPFCIHIMEKNI